MPSSTRRIVVICEQCGHRNEVIVSPNLPIGTPVEETPDDVPLRRSRRRRELPVSHPVEDD